MFIQETTTGERKILDLVDTTGSGDVDTSTIVRCEEKEGDDRRAVIKGKSGHSLTIPDDWENPSGEWHVGIKAAFELFPGSLRSRLQVRLRVGNGKMSNYLLLGVHLNHACCP